MIINSFIISTSLIYCYIIPLWFDCSFSRDAEKYIRRGRLDWPEGANSQESIRAVAKLPRLQVLVVFYD